MTAMMRPARLPNTQGHLFKEIIVDNFAGGGGASTGIEAAMGRPVDVAINHDIDAIRMHEVNHPYTRHYCESVWDVDPFAVCQGQPVGLAWFSPDCKHFSKARGKTPVNKNIRGLAWVALRWASTVKPRVIMLENVEEFLTWGPLRTEADGSQYPCPKRAGQTFKAFINALGRQGYAVSYRALRASDYGTPTIRKRLFLIARRDGYPIVWPESTHGDKPGLQPQRTAAECIDWTLECPSIFDRNRELAEATQRRIAKGIQRYVMESSSPFIVTYNHGGETFRGQAIGEPFKTITAARDAHGLVMPVLAPFITEHANASTQRNMSTDAPLRTICAQVKGGHFGLVTAFLAKHFTGVVGADLRTPMPTVTARDHNALVTSHLVKLRNNCYGQAVYEPMHTITAGGQHLGEVRAFLVKYYSEGGQWQSLDEPMHTIPTKDRLGLVIVHGEPYQIVDIGMRMLTPRELFNAQGFPPDYVIDRDSEGKVFSKAAQIARCGNSVCPPLAQALVTANLYENNIERIAA